MFSANGTVLTVHLFLLTRTLLWHGSRLSNWVGILSKGLRVAPPEAPVTGYMVGRLYFIQVTKGQLKCAFRESQIETSDFHQLLNTVLHLGFFFNQAIYFLQTSYNFFLPACLSLSLEKVFTLLTCHQRVPTTASLIRTTILDCCYCVR